MQIAVAAAIGVGGDLAEGVRIARLAPRLRGKAGMMPRRGQIVAGMGEINRSIEKMSLDDSYSGVQQGGCGLQGVHHQKQGVQGLPTHQTTFLQNNSINR